MSNNYKFFKTLNVERTGTQRSQWMFDLEFRPENIAPDLGPHDLVTYEESRKQALGLLTTSMTAGPTT